ncbi:hypothetical protein F4809DRAFT_594206 [Biscogniauxia mediterranea]|nr:hypothetical protein F4809DRAFT_594206 [Biscogniauxia mediterranea]
MHTCEPTMETTTELSIPLPRCLDTKIHLRLTLKSKVVLIFLTTVAADEADKSAPMGSFVYALPDKYNPNTPLATTIYSVEETLEFTTRLAKLLAKKTNMPIYLGNSISLANMGLGGTMEEEMEVFKKVVEVMLDKLQAIIVPSASLSNGV